MVFQLIPLKLNKAKTIYLKAGKLYSILSNIIRFDEVLYKLNPEIDFIPLDYSIFSLKRRTVEDLLMIYRFTNEEVANICNRLEIPNNMDTYNLSSRMRADLLIEIQLKNKNVIIMNIAGYSYLTAQHIYQSLYNEIKGTDKIGLLIEYINDDILETKEVNQELIVDYEIWIKHFQNKS